MFKLLLILVGLIATVCHGVRITGLKVPATYVLEDDDDKPDTLILDCEYEIGAGEKGFVLKWLLNDHPIYQWIPSHRPYALSYMKNRVDTNYSVSSEKLFKHRALAIVKPTWNMTGDYSCSVQTFESIDKKTAHLQIVVPEGDFQLSHSVDDDQMVNIKCAASNVFPQPKLTIVLNEDQLLEVTDRTKKDDEGLYDTHVYGKVVKDNLESPTTINCILAIPGTNYTKKRETIYYDIEITTTDEPKDLENSSLISRLEADDDGNSGSCAQVSFVVQSTMVLVATVSKWLLDCA